jgi:uncharacterized protein (TIGR03066 family)
MKTIALALAAFVMLSFSARAEDKADKLVGKWEATKGDIPAGSTAEFSKDGKIKVTLKRGDKTESKEGTYKLDGDTLKVTSKDGGMERTESFKLKKLTDKELVIGDKRDKEITFKKVK